MARAVDENQGGFDAAPDLGLLPVVVVLELLRLLRGFGDGLGALHFVELAGVALHLGGVHRALQWLLLASPATPAPSPGSGWPRDRCSRAKRGRMRGEM